MKVEVLSNRLPKGSIVALITPFAKGKVDFCALGRLIDWHKKVGTNGIVLLGTTGESATLTQKEKTAIVEFGVQRANKEIFIFVGSGSNDTEKATKQSVMMEKLGADGLLVVTPYYNKANEEGMTKHFLKIADSTNLPIVLYNVPSRTGCWLSVKVAGILKNHPNICGTKEASSDISYATKMACLVDQNFCMYCGNDDIIVPMLSIGAIGVISVWANIMPKACLQLTDSWFEGKTEQAKNIQLKNLNLINLLFAEPNPIPVKTAMKYLKIDSGECRLPLSEMKQDKEKLIEEINFLNILNGLNFPK